MPFQFRLRTLFAIIALVAIGLFVYDATQETRWDGSFKLTMKFPDKEITNLSLVCLNDRKVAVPLAKSQMTYETTFSSTIYREYVVGIHCWGTESGLGWHSTYDHDRYVVIWADFRDGSQVCQLVTIPYGRGPRTIEVNFDPEKDQAVLFESLHTKPKSGSEGT
jgi:hypothetical protein